MKRNRITISVSLLEFGQLRPKPLKGERYRISWFKDGVLETRYDDETRFTLPVEEARAIWEVEVRLLTPEVRKDIHGVLSDYARFDFA